MFEFSNSALFLFLHIRNNHNKPIRASSNKAFNLELKFPYILNVLSYLLLAEYLSQDMWLFFFIIYGLHFLCLFISCSPGEHGYNRLKVRSFFDPVVWIIYHKVYIKDWLFLNKSDLEIKIETKYMERFLKSKHVVYTTTKR